MAAKLAVARTSVGVILSSATVSMTAISAEAIVSATDSPYDGLFDACMKNL
jgi:hypothetical protein